MKYKRKINFTTVGHKSRLNFGWFGVGLRIGGGFKRARAHPHPPPRQSHLTRAGSYRLGLVGVGWQCRT